MHLQNPHRNPYKFELLIQANEELEAFVFTNEHEIQTIDFAMEKSELLKGFYTSKLQDISDLRQSLLQKAFAGELT